jgi:glycogen debranching enzyme
MIAHYHRIRDKTGYGVASHDPDEPNFDSMRYWRGPVWAFMNMMIGKGFRDQGYMSEALAGVGRHAHTGQHRRLCRVFRLQP